MHTLRRLVVAAAAATLIAVLSAGAVLADDPAAERPERDRGERAAAALERVAAMCERLPDDRQTRCAQRVRLMRARLERLTERPSAELRRDAGGRDGERRVHRGEWRQQLRAVAIERMRERCATVSVAPRHCAWLMPGAERIDRPDADAREQRPNAADPVRRPATTGRSGARGNSDR